MSGPASARRSARSWVSTCSARSPRPTAPGSAGTWRRVRAAAGGFNAATGVRAAVRYTPQPWGTELEASVSGIAPGTRCQVWATTGSGHQAAGGSWTIARGDPHAWYPASVPFPVTSLAGFDITGGGKILVAIPLRPGTPPTPSTAAAPPATIP